MVTIPIYDSGIPKIDIIQMAFEDCALAGFTFEQSPEEVASALRKLNVMMAESPWNRLGYVQPDNGSQGEATDLSGLPADTVNAVSGYLAQRLAASIGKSFSTEAGAQMAKAYNLLFAQNHVIPKMRLAPDTPVGQGSYPNAYWWGPFTPPIG